MQWFQQQIYFNHLEINKTSYGSMPLGCSMQRAKELKKILLIFSQLIRWCHWNRLHFIKETKRKLNLK